MKRRTFIKRTGALGFGAALPWPDVMAQDAPATAFLRDKTSDRMLFPRPHDGAEVKISPVGLAWLPYRKTDQGRFVPDWSDAG